MSDIYTPSDSTSRSDSAPPITTLAGLKNETHTAVVQYFAPVVALYNVMAVTAGLPVVRWEAVGNKPNGRQQS